ncbi:MgtC/SapB family protein [Ruminococcus sp. OA3]|uniref:MgtC/SapB family protein n=1 Tax=Ruminococcus sp. OA3 TaxID=2914164 RepID=UPI001F05F9DA|nr:MgtC/SapB family protein [Ruminococcus sp. OA3]MCH1981354.1 MgtC/SapB family protein [Ruminococcus sp. OA3]
MFYAQHLNEVISISQEVAFFARIFVACLCGAAIGFERTSRFKQAGVRTHCIIACTAAVMMIVSKYSFADLGDASGGFFSGTRGADPARIAAQVVSGISFLGAGVLLKKGDSIKGLTTAAGFWVTSAIGLAIGSGMYYVGLFTTVLVIILQIILHRVHIAGDASAYEIGIVMQNSIDLRNGLMQRLKEEHRKVTVCKISKNEDGTMNLQLLIKSSDPLSLDQTLELLDSEEWIRSISRQ